jgi:hypothetical protein
MPTFRVDYTKPRGSLSDDQGDRWDYAPEQVTANGYTIDSTWVTFWADHSRDPKWAPPPVLRVRTKDVGRIEWLDRPEPDADSFPIRLVYQTMALFTDAGGIRHHDELLVGRYEVGDDFTRCLWNVPRPEPEPLTYGPGDELDDKPPVLTVRTDTVQRIERVEPSIRPISREPTPT